MRGLDVSMSKMAQIMSLMPRIERQENKVDMLVQFTTELQKIYSLA